MEETGLAIGDDGLPILMIGLGAAETGEPKSPVLILPNNPVKDCVTGNAPDLTVEVCGVTDATTDRMARFDVLKAVMRITPLTPK